MKRIVGSFIIAMLLLGPLGIAGHPKKYKNDRDRKLETNEFDPRDKDEEVTKEDFPEMLNEYFDHRKQFLQGEISNQYYGHFLHLPTSKYHRWLAQIAKNRVSKDLYSILFLFSREDAVRLLESRPNGTGLIRAVYHEKGSIAVSYVEDDRVKHLLTDTSKLDNPNLRNVLFIDAFNCLTHLLVQGHDSKNEPAIISLPKEMLGFPLEKIIK